MVMIIKTMRIKRVRNKKFTRFLKDRGMKTKRLAEKLGVSQKTVQNWCNGRNRPRMEYVIDMAKLFEVTIEGMYEIMKG